MKHTKGPWRARFSGSNRRIVIDHKGFGFVAILSERPNYDEEQANARFIVKAVNSHDELVTLLKAAIARVELANLMGDPILAAWLIDAQAAIHNATKE